jgi:hypothetical protein
MRNKTWYWNLWWDFAYMFDLYKLNWIFTRQVKYSFIEKWIIYGRVAVKLTLVIYMFLLGTEIGKWLLS